MNTISPNKIQVALKFKPFRLAETNNRLANALNAPIEKCFSERRMYMTLAKTQCISNYDMANMLMNDAKDLREIRNHIIKGRFDLAAKKMYPLDTAVRDIIPSHLYNIIDLYND